MVKISSVKCYFGSKSKNRLFFKNIFSGAYHRERRSLKKTSPGYFLLLLYVNFASFVADHLNPNLVGGGGGANAAPHRVFCLLQLNGLNN